MVKCKYCEKEELSKFLENIKDFKGIKKCKACNKISIRKK